MASPHQLHPLHRRTPASTPATSLRSDRAPAPGFIQESAAFRALLESTALYARCDDVPICIEGESGTGKTCLARHIHQISPRAGRAFEQVTLSELDDNLASSDLFGHVAGAFTDARQSRQGFFVAANGGTLFLDEIGRASPAVQRKLLHAVEYRTVRPLGTERTVPVDTRLIVATSTPLAQLVERGEFLPDLRASVGMYLLRVPPLRERRADIPGLVRQLIAMHAPKAGYDDPPVVDDSLMDALTRAEWELNIRELESVVRVLLIFAGGASILSQRHCRGTLGWLQLRAAGPLRSERARRILEIFAETHNESETARRVGCARTTVRRTLAAERRKKAGGERASLDADGCSADGDATGRGCSATEF